MLTLIIILPILGSLFFFGINEDNGNSILKSRNNSIIKQIGLATSLITLIYSLIIFSQMNFSTIGYQFNDFFTPTGYIAIDGISIYYVLLTTFITPVCLLSN
jgi:NADH:ubiquinone oxidoreductase subunit 4 (subunit M)